MYHVIPVEVGAQLGIGQALEPALKGHSEECLETTRLVILHDPEEWSLRFLFRCSSALCLLVITHKPRGCLGNLVNHLRKEKQTSYAWFLLVFLRSVLEEGEQSETVLLFKQCLERCTFYVVALFFFLNEIGLYFLSFSTKLIQCHYVVFCLRSHSSDVPF